MDQLPIFVTVLNSASGFLRFLLTASKIRPCRSGERNNRTTGKKKLGYYFPR